MGKSHGARSASIPSTNPQTDAPGGVADAPHADGDDEPPCSGYSHGQQHVYQHHEQHDEKLAEHRARSGTLNSVATPTTVLPSSPDSSSSSLNDRLQGTAPIGDASALKHAALEATKPTAVAQVPRSGHQGHHAPSGGPAAGAGSVGVHQPHTLEPETVLEKLNSSQTDGLNETEAATRLADHGSNQLKENKGISLGTILLRQVANALTLVLVAAMALSFGVRDWVEGGVVTAVILTNVILGFWQEYAAERTMASLRSLSSPTADVLRSGKVNTVPSRDLVPGDIVLFSTGDVLPADVRLLSISNLEVDEAPLTGESVPVAKIIEALPEADLGPADRINLGYASTTVTKGRGTGIVIATGMSTQIGQIAAAMARGEGAVKNQGVPVWKRAWEKCAKFLGLRDGTPLQIRLNKFAYLLLFLAIICAIIVFSVAEFDIDNETILYAIALAIGVIPESLVAVLTVTFAVGAKRMAQSNVIVRKLDALEALGGLLIRLFFSVRSPADRFSPCISSMSGGVTDICSDKTGTLTQGKMVVRKCWVPTGPKDAQSAETGTTYGVEQAGATAFEPAGRVFTASSQEPEKEEYYESNALPNDVSVLATAASLCNVAELTQVDGTWTARGDPTEIALQVFASKVGLGRSVLAGGDDSRYSLETEFPFDSTVKRMTSAYRDSKDDEHVRKLFMKGAVERVLECCTTIVPATLADIDAAPRAMDDSARTQILAQMELLASEGLRVLAFARRITSADDMSGGVEKAAPILSEAVKRMDVEQQFEFLGLAGLYDPPRPETRDAVLACQRAGIVVHMLTGDHPATARSIAREVAIIDGSEPVSAVMTAAQFDGMTDEEMDALPDLPVVVARCSPATKVRMIAATKRRGRFCSMTGDGINDAPSLKQAPVGIAMGITGTDVAKDSADLVLVDDRFDSIVKAVAEGRTIFDNIQRFIIALLVANVGEVILLLIGLAFRDDADESVFPLSPIAILWCNMVTASLPAVGLGLEAGGKDIMNRPPHDLKSGVFSRAVLVDTFFYGSFFLSSFSHYTLHEPVD